MGQELRRITVEEVKQSMEKTGAKLHRGVTWSNPGFGPPCGCPIGVVAAAHGLYEGKGDPIGLAVLGIAEAGLELNKSYTTGFVNGFDGFNTRSDWNDDALIGYSDGLAVADALLPKSNNR